MRLLVSGCRDGVTYGDVLIAIALSGITGVTELISCSARGTDLFSEKWAKFNKIPVRRIPLTFSKDNLYAEQNQLDKAIRECDEIIMLSNCVSIRGDYIIHHSSKSRKSIFIHHIEPSPIPFVDPVEPKVRNPRKIKNK